MTFLDIVRRMAEITECEGDCSLRLHRREAAQHLFVLMSEPQMLYHLVEFAEDELYG